MVLFLAWFFADHRSDAVAEDLTGAIGALLGINPEYAYRFVTKAFQPDKRPAACSRHEERVEVCLAGFGFSGDSDEFGFGKTRSTVPGEEGSVGRDLRIGSDPEELQLLDDG